jgi:hypothetical protein
MVNKTPQSTNRHPKEPLVISPIKEETNRYECEQRHGLSEYFKKYFLWLVIVVVEK